MKLNDVYELNIIDENNLGNGIAKLDNFTIFVPSTLKNEKVLVKITSIKKNYANAKLLKIIEKSSERINVKCPYYNNCGGCVFLHTNYDNEINIKIRYLERLFNRKVNYIKNNNINNYRNKVVLHVKEGKLGYFKDETNTLCEINYCLLLNKKINLIIDELRTKDLSDIYEIMIRVINNKSMINIKTLKNINDFNINVDSLYINNKYIKGDKYLIDDINNIKYSIYPQSFYQTNNEAMQLIYNKALEYSNNDNSLLDLYCGTGTIGIWLKDKFNKITGIEINESSIENAKLNIKLNNLNNFKFICSDAKNIKDKFDQIVVDPPRKGLSKEVTSYLNNSNTKKIIYISCNPNTLKRDIDLLDNYILKDISCVNMFPRTKHCETVCVLERK